MQQKAVGFVAVAAALATQSIAGCAVGIGAEAHPDRDSGVATRRDSGSPKNDGSNTPPIEDSGPTSNNNGTPIQDGGSCNFTVCGSLCVDTSNDDNNCGGCGQPCTGGTSCSSGTCQCAIGMAACGGTCVDTATDNSNCGACNVPCGPNTTCTNSTCQPQTTTSNAPPQGSCVHGLCDANLDYLDMGCDPNGCVTAVCTADSVCCDPYYVGGWDSICVSEVAQYCSPYACQ